MKKFSMIIIIVIFTCLPVSANELETYDYSRFDNNTYVYDIGDNLSGDLETVNEVFGQLRSKYAVTYTFIIVDDFNGEAIELADRIWYNAGYDHDYISVVISVKNRDLAVYTQGRGINVMNDNYVEGMLDALVVSLKDDDWAGALITFADLAEKMTDSYIDRTLSVRDQYGNIIRASMIASEAAPFKLNIGSIILWAVIAGAIVTLIALITELAKHKPVKKATHADYYVDDNNVNISRTEDSFLRTRETRVKISSDSGGKGGGGRAGGSTSTRSSGRSSGGGSRKF